MDGYRSWLENSDPSFKKKLIADFIQKTISYAEEHIRMRDKELSLIPPGDKEEIRRREERLFKWNSYVEFQTHTLQELSGEKIDDLIP